MVMPNPVKVFPRGYSGGQSSSIARDETRQGDPEVSRLYDVYTGPANPSNTWEFRKQVIKAAVRLFGGSTNWFLRQDPNPMVTEYNYQFLLDTLRFIATGHRRIAIYGWPDLISNYSAGSLPAVRERRDIANAFRELALTTSTEDLLQLWCQRRGGFDDLMQTLNLLFGDVKVKANHVAMGGMRS